MGSVKSRRGLCPDCIEAGEATRLRVLLKIAAKRLMNALVHDSGEEVNECLTKSIAFSEPQGIILFVDRLTSSGILAVQNTWRDI